MIEKTLHLIIEDLGATGVLIVGIFLIQYGATKKICSHLKILNHKSTAITQKLDEILDYWKHKLGDKK